MATNVKKITKTEIAKRLGISRSSLYYKPKREQIDLEVKFQIESVMTDNPYYGHKRIALALKLNKKRILRVMKKYYLRPLQKKARFMKRADMKRPQAKYENLVEKFCPIRANIVWVCDFTYIKYQSRFIYLAVVIDMFTRKVIGYNISRFHNKSLVVDAFLDAVKTTGVKPQYIHSDQGSEYDSQIYTSLAEQFGIIISMSDKGSPWENGYVESFFGKFKDELGDLNRFEDLAKVVEKVYRQVWYYNNRRIHSSLKMSPVEFCNLSRDSVSKEMGT